MIISTDHWNIYWAFVAINLTDQINSGKTDVDMLPPSGQFVFVFRRKEVLSLSLSYLSPSEWWGELMFELHR